MKCDTFWEALPLAQGYLIYLTLIGILSALCWFYGIKALIFEKKQRKDCIDFLFGGAEAEFKNNFEEHYEEASKPLLERIAALEARSN